MADYTVKRFDEMEPILGGAFRRTRASLGATSFGMQILEMPPDAGDFYPNHDHADSGQEEVYILLAGSATFKIEDDQVEMSPQMAVRVGPRTKRKIRAGHDGAQILVVGGVPGAIYEPPAFTELGGPDPVAPPELLKD